MLGNFVIFHGLKVMLSKSKVSWQAFSILYSEEKIVSFAGSSLYTEVTERAEL